MFEELISKSTTYSDTSRFGDKKKQSKDSLQDDKSEYLGKEGEEL